MLVVHVVYPQIVCTFVLSALVQPECGNDILEEGEECDGNDLGDVTCPQHHGNM